MMIDSLKYNLIEEDNYLNILTFIKNSYPNNTYLGKISTFTPTITFNSLCAMFSGNFKLNNLIDKYILDRP